MIDPVTGAIIGQVGSAVLGGLFGSSSAKSANKAAAKEAALNREFQERMAKNAHQYEAADLEAAGLNRVLSLGGGGAATPGGATGAVVATEAGEAAKGVSSALEAARSVAELQNLKADTLLKGASAAQAVAGAKKTQQDTINQGIWTSAKAAAGRFVSWAVGKGEGAATQPGAFKKLIGPAIKDTSFFNPNSARKQYKMGRGSQ